MFGAFLNIYNRAIMVYIILGCFFNFGIYHKSTPFFNDSNEKHFTGRSIDGGLYCLMYSNSIILNISENAKKLIF